MHTVGADRALNHHVKMANTGNGGMRERVTSRQRDVGGLNGINRTHQHIQLARLGDSACPWPVRIRNLRLEGPFMPHVNMLKAACTGIDDARERGGISYRDADGRIGRSRTHRHV